MYNNCINKIKKQIDNSQIVSFDIFDTLLFRPYLKPTDLFYHLGKIENSPLFAKTRIYAESRARKDSINDDITIDEIYCYMPQKFQGFKEKEIALEFQVSTINPEIKQIYDYAILQKKTIILTSDMYLPSAVIIAILKKNGITKYDKLYLSNEEKISKATGHLYKKIINDFSIVARKIVHIGDNKNSDYKKARKNNINAILYKPIVKRIIKEDPKYVEFAQYAKVNIGASILLATILLHKITTGNYENYWKYLGFEYCGPVCYAYSSFIEKAASNSNIEKLFFVARDGYTLQKVFNIRNKNKIQTEYIYAPRIFNLIFRGVYDSSNLAQMESIIRYHRNFNPELRKLISKTKLVTKEEYADFIKANSSLINLYGKEKFDNYRKYLLSKSIDGNIGIIDSLTWNYSAQSLIEEILGKKVLGIYWNVAFPREFDIDVFSKSAEKQYYTNVYRWSVMEFLLSSPEYPVKDIDVNGNPIIDNKANDYEKYRAEKYNEISNEAISFANYINTIFGDLDICIQYEDIVEWINSYIKNPNKKDFDNMKKIKIGDDEAHTKYVSIFCMKTSIKDLILHPLKTLKLISQQIWQSPIQTIFISPISIRMKGFKQIKIEILPKCIKKYLDLNIRIKKCTISISIGNRKKIILTEGK